MEKKIPHLRESSSALTGHEDARYSPVLSAVVVLLRALDTMSGVSEIPSPTGTQAVGQRLETLLTIPELAAVLHVKVYTARELCRSGKIETVTIGDKLQRVEPEAVRRYLEKRRRHGPIEGVRQIQTGEMGR